MNQTFGGRQSLRFNKWFAAALYGVIVLIVLICREDLMFAMKQGHGSVFLVYLLAAGFALVPAFPYSLVIGTIGFVYGAWEGALISLAGALTAAAITFAVARCSLRTRGREWLAKSRRIESFNRMIERSPFIGILFARLIPVVPQALVNAYPALLSVPFGTYLAASAIGKIPGMLTYAFIGDRISDVHELLLIAGIYGLFLLGVYGVYRVRLRQR
jgi:uncharacterized membrane protein YdjX (TVP38/TMEM64 family)